MLALEPARNIVLSEPLQGEKSKQPGCVLNRDVCIDRGHMGGCQNYGPFLGTLNNKCRIIIRTQKGTIVLTTTHMDLPRSEPQSSVLPRHVELFTRVGSALNLTHKIPKPRALFALKQQSLQHFLNLMCVLFLASAAYL